ncbi:unnamed protein product [Orchesella dallaii]|uniref:Uncharacterized protein n=1 Tax=Orchesella dallaii TaxID=48710 RepID=A0ABP1R765_9HEXA
MPGFQTDILSNSEEYPDEDNERESEFHSTSKTTRITALELESNVPLRKVCSDSDHSENFCCVPFLVSSACAIISISIVVIHIIYFYSYKRLAVGQVGNSRFCDENSLSNPKEEEEAGEEEKKEKQFSLISKLIGSGGKTLGEFIRDYEVHVLYEFVFIFFQWVFFLYVALLIG